MCAAFAFGFDQNFLTSVFSYVAYPENFTMSMTHGFSIKAPGTNAPQYFDLTGTWGKLVYTDDKDQQQFIDPYVAICLTLHIVW